jgi:hypothetical protein
MAIEKINWPFGAADKQAIAYAANPVVTITNMFTILTFAILTGDLELDLIIDDEVKPGAMLLIRVPATANADDVTFGDGIDAPNLVGVATKTKTQLFVYDGVAFIPAGGPVQID